MSVTASLSLSSLHGKSINDLPNLPGVRRNAASSNPRLFKDYLAKSNASLLESSQKSDVLSYFEDPEYFNSLSESLNPHPIAAQSFNDINGRYSIYSQKQDRKSNIRPLPYSDLSHVPSFVVNKDHSCVFSAYFWENVPENLKESQRVRHVDIVVSTVTNTIEIFEPALENSGLWQGKQLRKHQIPKPVAEGEAPGSNGYYTLHDFYSGAKLIIYGKEYTICNCSPFSRRYLSEELGINFGPPKSLPPLSDIRSQVRSTSTTSFGDQPRTHAKSSSKKFFQNDKMVLRFYGFWKGNEYPNPIQYTVKIHYYLTDDTIEILSEYRRNDGRDRMPKFLRRMRVIKPDSGPAELDTGSVALEPMINSNLYYHYSDLKIGDYLQVVGNSILIYDADNYTRRFYEQNGQPLGDAIPIELEEKHEKVIVEPPPHNGFGSEEDSLQTCKGSLMPKPPKKDGLKAQLFAGVILRYRLKLSNPKPSDVAREFTLQVFLEDDTIQIRELPVRNSGFTGGKFLSRGKQYHSNGKQITPSDISIGSSIFVQSFKFDILDADEFSLKYMEQHPEIWKESSIDEIALRLREKESALKDMLLILKEKALEEVPYQQIEQMLERVDIKFTPQEKLTLFRRIDRKKKGVAKFFRIFKILEDEELFLSWSSPAGKK